MSNATKEKGKMKLKVCGMQKADNIEQIAAHEPDFLGYIFYAKSARGVKIGDDLLFPDNVVPVAVVVNEPFDFILKLREKYGFTHIQLHGNEAVEFCKQLKAEGFTVFKAFSIAAAEDFSPVAEFAGAIDYALYDTKGKMAGGNGVQFNWDLLQLHPLTCPFFLSGGIGEQDADAVVKAYQANERMVGVDVNSKFEIEPGLKNPESVGRFVSDLRK